MNQQNTTHEFTLSIFKVKVGPSRRLIS